MSRKSQSVILLLCSLFCFSLALPTAKKISDCALDDDDCREDFMHPNLPPSIGRMLTGEETSAYWLQNGKNFVAHKVATADTPQRGVAKNVIMFLGDGMGLTTLAATRVYIGGEERNLSFEEFSDTGLARTYSLDHLVPDSANTATAYLCGVKAMMGTLGVDGHVKRSDCAASKNKNYYVDSIAKMALTAGKSVGIVTTAKVTDASPSGVYAHIADRMWESDQMVKQDCGPNSGISDIATQLIEGEVGRQAKVVLGGGKAHFIDKDLYCGGYRGDGRNLIEEFLAQNASNVFIETADDLRHLRVGDANRVLGLFNDDNMQYNLQADRQEPTFNLMVQKAMELLSENPNGYFLFAEGALIDKAHHGTNAKMALDETAEFSEAIGYARRSTKVDDTLIVVTADHSHTLSIGGYARRGNDIFGTAALGTDEKPYTTLSYANGPGYNLFFSPQTHTRVNPEILNFGNSADVFPATAPMSYETHGGDDVAVFASGPWAHLFSGSYEQSVIPHMMAFSACLGTGLKACD